MDKKRILILNKFYLPGYKAGGPIRSIESLVDALSDSFEFYIVTTDRDSGDTSPYQNIFPNSWNKVGKANVFYLNSEKLSFFSIKKLIDETEYDLFYLNSFFNPRFSIFPLLYFKLIGKTSKVIVAPRGEFSKGALQINSLKKNFFIKLSRAIGLHRDVIWQASSDYEKSDILRIYKNSLENIFIAPNLSSSKSLKPVNKEYDGTLRIIFLSRISEKKNLDFGLELFKECKFSVQFSVYGNVGEEIYWEKCKKIIAELPSNVEVIYHGPVPHDRVVELIQKYDLFFLPTRGENYGHAIVEAFIAGTPVLVSDTTPWRNLEQHGVGWDISLEDKSKFLKIMKTYKLQLEKGNRLSSKHIQEWIDRQTTDPSVLQASYKLFSQNARD